jgi:RNA polymerase sigma-70 factor (ECF subfamily)
MPGYTQLAGAWLQRVLPGRLVVDGTIAASRCMVPLVAIDVRGRFRHCNQSTLPDDMADNANPNDFEAGLKPLWLRAQAGDDGAYRQALERIATRVRAYLRRRMQSLPDDLEDLVQETLLALHLQRGTYDPALPVSAWVLAIARHKLVDLWRRRGRHEALHDAIDDVDEAALAAAGGGESEARRDLGKLLDDLPGAQRQAILLTKVEGLSVAEASLRTGVSQSAIKVQVHRGLKRLAALVKG